MALSSRIGQRLSQKEKNQGILLKMSNDLHFPLEENNVLYVEDIPYRNWYMIHSHKLHTLRRLLDKINKQSWFSLYHGTSHGESDVPTKPLFLAVEERKPKCWLLKGWKMKSAPDFHLISCFRHNGKSRRQVHRRRIHSSVHQDSAQCMEYLKSVCVGQILVRRRTKFN